MIVTKLREPKGHAQEVPVQGVGQSSKSGVYGFWSCVLTYHVVLPQEQAKQIPSVLLQNSWGGPCHLHMGSFYRMAPFKNSFQNSL